MKTTHQDAVTLKIHPPIAVIEDALSFRVAQFNLINDRLGAMNFVARFGITLNEWRVIGLTHSGDRPTHSDVRRQLIMDKGQMSRIVRSLSERGFLQTQEAESDKRALRLELSTEGRILHDHILAEASRRNEAVASCFTAEECREFLRLLGKLTDHAIVRAAEEGVEP